MTGLDKVDLFLDALLAGANIAGCIVMAAMLARMVWAQANWPEVTAGMLAFGVFFAASYMTIRRLR